MPSKKKRTGTLIAPINASAEHLANESSINAVTNIANSSHSTTRRKSLISGSMMIVCCCLALFMLNRDSPYWVVINNGGAKLNELVPTSVNKFDTGNEFQVGDDTLVFGALEGTQSGRTPYSVSDHLVFHAQPNELVVAFSSPKLKEEGLMSSTASPQWLFTPNIVPKRFTASEERNNKPTSMITDGPIFIGTNVPSHPVTRTVKALSTSDTQLFPARKLVVADHVLVKGAIVESKTKNLTRGRHINIGRVSDIGHQRVRPLKNPMVLLLAPTRPTEPSFALPQASPPIGNYFSRSLTGRRLPLEQVHIKHAREWFRRRTTAALLFDWLHYYTEPETRQLILENARLATEENMSLSAMNKLVAAWREETIGSSGRANIGAHLLNEVNSRQKESSPTPVPTTFADGIRIGIVSHHGYHSTSAKTAQKYRRVNKAVCPPISYFRDPVLNRPSVADLLRRNGNSSLLVGQSISVNFTTKTTLAEILAVVAKLPNDAPILIPLQVNFLSLPKSESPPPPTLFFSSDRPWAALSEAPHVHIRIQLSNGKGIIVNGCELLYVLGTTSEEKLVLSEALISSLAVPLIGAIGAPFVTPFAPLLVSASERGDLFRNGSAFPRNPAFERLKKMMSEVSGESHLVSVGVQVLFDPQHPSSFSPGRIERFPRNEIVPPTDDGMLVRFHTLQSVVDGNGPSSARIGHLGGGSLPHDSSDRYWNPDLPSPWQQACPGVAAEKYGPSVSAFASAIEMPTTDQSLNGSGKAVVFGTSSLSARIGGVTSEPLHFMSLLGAHRPVGGEFEGKTSFVRNMSLLNKHLYASLFQYPLALNIDDIKTRTGISGEDNDKGPSSAEGIQTEPEKSDGLRGRTPYWSKVLYLHKSLNEAETNSPKSDTADLGAEVFDGLLYNDYFGDLYTFLEIDRDRQIFQSEGHSRKTNRFVSTASAIRATYNAMILLLIDFSLPEDDLSYGNASNPVISITDLPANAREWAVSYVKNGKSGQKEKGSINDVREVVTHRRALLNILSARGPNPSGDGPSIRHPALLLSAEATSTFNGQWKALSDWFMNYNRPILEQLFRRYLSNHPSVNMPTAAKIGIKSDRDALRSHSCHCSADIHFNPNLYQYGDFPKTFSDGSVLVLPNPPLIHTNIASLYGNRVEELLAQKRRVTSKIYEEANEAAKVDRAYNQTASLCYFMLQADVMRTLFYSGSLSYDQIVSRNVIEKSFVSMSVTGGSTFGHAEQIMKDESRFNHAQRALPKVTPTGSPIPKISSPLAASIVNSVEIADRIQRRSQMVKAFIGVNDMSLMAVAAAEIAEVKLLTSVATPTSSEGLQDSKPPPSRLSHDYVLWIDNDVVITNMTIPLEALLANTLLGDEGKGITYASNYGWQPTTPQPSPNLVGISAIDISTEASNKFQYDQLFAALSSTPISKQSFASLGGGGHKQNPYWTFLGQNFLNELNMTVVDPDVFPLDLRIPFDPLGSDTRADILTADRKHRLGKPFDATERYHQLESLKKTLLNLEVPYEADVLEISDEAITTSGASSGELGRNNGNQISQEPTTISARNLEHQMARNRYYDSTTALGAVVPALVGRGSSLGPAFERAFTYRDVLSYGGTVRRRLLRYFLPEDETLAEAIRAGAAISGGPGGRGRKRRAAGTGDINDPNRTPFEDRRRMTTDGSPSPPHLVDVIASSQSNIVNNGVFFLRNSPWIRHYWLPLWWNSPNSTWMWHDNGGFISTFSTMTVGTGQGILNRRHLAVTPGRVLNAFYRGGNFKTSNNAALDRINRKKDLAFPSQYYQPGDFLIHFPTFGPYELQNRFFCESLRRNKYLLAAQGSLEWDDLQLNVRDEKGLPSADKSVRMTFERIPMSQQCRADLITILDHLLPL